MVYRTQAIRHIVSSGDQAPVAADGTVFTYTGKRLSYNVAKGQLVFYVQENGTTRTLDHTTLTAADIPKLYVGVGHDADGDGLVDSIRHIGVESISGCNINDVTVSSPKCGNPEVVDFFFDCVHCGEDYTLEVAVDDNFTRSYAPLYRSAAKYWSTVTPDCNTCDGCPPEPTCDEIVCRLVDSINDDVELKLLDKSYPDWNRQGVELPFKAVKIHDRALVYCLAGTVAEDCENCEGILPAITHIRVTDAAAEPQTVALTGTTYTIGTDTVTLKAQLQHVADQINMAFEAAGNRHGGYAYITGNDQSPCCSVQLHVNTCDADFEIASGIDFTPDTGDIIVPTSETNPFTEHGSITLTPDCEDCSAEDATRDFTCGIRFIAAPLSGDCSCYVDKPLQFYGRTLEVTPVGEGWTHRHWKTEKVQKLELPAGFGSYIQWLEYKQSIGGQGRNYAWSNNNQGFFNLPDKKSRVNNAYTAECGVDYCSYKLASEQPYTNHNGKHDLGRIDSYVHVPSGDSTTLAAWENFLDALIALAPGCPALAEVACTTIEYSCGGIVE